MYSLPAAKTLNVEGNNHMYKNTRLELLRDATASDSGAVALNQPSSTLFLSDLRHRGGPQQEKCLHQTYYECR